MALVIALAALSSLVAASWIRIHEVVTDRNGIVTDRIDGTAHSFSRELRGRVELADALARYLTAADGGAAGVLLRERMLTADAFHGVALFPFKESARDDSDQLSADERLKLKAGQSLLKIATPEAGHTGIYLLRVASAANSPQLASYAREAGVSVFPQLAVQRFGMAAIVDQALEGMPGGPWITDDPKVVLPPREELHTSMESLIHHFKIVTEGYRVPEGEVYVATETARGEFGCYVVSDGGPKPWRVKFRAPSFVALEATATCMRNALVADLIAIVGSLDTVMGEVDR